MRKAAVARRAEDESVASATVPEPAAAEALGDGPEPETPALRKARRATATAEPTDGVDAE